jgi:hypothetical protein
MADKSGCRAAHGSAADAGGIDNGPGGDPAPIWPVSGGTESGESVI